MQLIALAARHALPAIYIARICRGWRTDELRTRSFPDAFRQTRRLRRPHPQGREPADLPVMQPTKFDLVINLKTAKALGIEIPPTLFAPADEVIE